MKWQLPYGEGDGVQVFEFDDDRMSASEARVQKRMTDGASPIRAGELRREGDPDALLAALVIARKRSGMSDTEAVAINPDHLDVVDAVWRTFQLVADAVEQAAASAEKSGEEPKPPRRTRRAKPASVATQDAADGSEALVVSA